MPVRKKPQTDIPTTLKFTRENLSVLGDLDIKAILSSVGLSDTAESAAFTKSLGIDRILQEQRQGFEPVNQELLDQYLQTAAIVVQTYDKVQPTKKEQDTPPKMHVKTKGVGDENAALLLGVGNVSTVTYSLREVKNLGNYESLQIGVSVTLPVNPTQEDIDAAKTTLIVAKGLCLDQLNADMDELLNP